MTPMVRCSGCDLEMPAGTMAPYRCPHATGDDDIDHMVVPLRAENAEQHPEELNPFLRFKEFLHPYHLARHLGVDAQGYRLLVEELDRALARVAGTGFRVTPLRAETDLERDVGVPEGFRIWGKDETGNVGGSHKARHLMAILLYLRLVACDAPPTPRLAIASCGNAALSAALLANAAGWALEVFVPCDAEASVVSRIEELGASLRISARASAGVGDPCVRAFREAVDGGAVPFSVQGSENGLVIEGGKTLGLEIIAQCRERGVAPDHVFLQVGGGALASSVARAFQEWSPGQGGLPCPRIHTVQTRAVHPLKLAFDRVVARIEERAPSKPQNRDHPLARADWLRERVPPALIEEELQYAARHRSQFMEPWRSRGRSSQARGILDAETYDWRALVEAMIESGGIPLVVDEDGIRRAHRVARKATGLDISATGTAGLGGLLLAQERCGLLPGESAVLVWTGVR